MEQVAGFNPRWEAYARAHGNSVDEQKADDAKNWPGGVACGFILWMSEQKQAFFKAHPEAFIDRHSICDFEKWDEFLGVPK